MQAETDFIMTAATKLSARPHSSWLLWHFIGEWTWLSLPNSKRIFLDAEVLHKDVQSLPGGFLGWGSAAGNFEQDIVDLPDTL